MQFLYFIYSVVLVFWFIGWIYLEKIGFNLLELKFQCSGVVIIYGVFYSEYFSYLEF